MSEREITISGLTFSTPQPYAEGHVISSAEAHTLNQTFAENIRNNVAGKIKAHLKKAEVSSLEELNEDQLSALRSDAETMIEKYEFSGAGRGGSARAPADPILREALRIAGELVKAALSKRGTKIKDLPEGKFDELVEGVLDRNPGIKAEAERRVAASKAVAEDLLDDIAA